MRCLKLLHRPTLAILVFYMYLFGLPISLSAKKRGQPLIDSLLLVIKNLKDDTVKADILNDIASEYEEIDPRIGLQYAGRSMQLSERLNWQPGIAHNFNAIGVNHRMLGNLDSAKSCFHKALNLFEQLGNKKGSAAAIINIGNVYLYQGNSKEAETYYTQALKISKELNDKNGIGIAYMNLGGVYRAASDYSKAVEYFKQSLKIKEELQDAAGIAGIYQMLALVYNGQYRFDLAIDYNKKAIAILEQQGSTTAAIRVRTNLGAAYLTNKDTAEALEKFRKVQSSLYASDETTVVAMECMGLIYISRHEYAKAIQSFRVGYEAAIKTGNANYVGMLQGDLGYAYLTAAEDSLLSQRMPGYSRQQLARLALQYSIPAMELCKAQQAKSPLKDCYANLASEYEILGDTKAALKYLQLHNDIAQELYNEQNTETIAKLHEEYEGEKKSAAIKLLNQEKSLQALKLKSQQTNRNYLLGGMLSLLAFGSFGVYNYTRRRKLSFSKSMSETEMKALRAQMNPHFIFNSLNSIYAFLQAQRYEEAQQYLLKFAKLTRMILENSQYQSIPLDDELTALQLYLELEAFRLNKKMEFEIIVDDSLDRQLTLIPPMILQPFIENAIWHGILPKESGGRITVRIVEKDELLQCTVEDDGVGRVGASTIKQGLATQKAASLGLKLTEERINIINKLKKSKGYVAVTDIKDVSDTPAGVKVELVLPLEKTS